MRALDQTSKEAGAALLAGLLLGGLLLLVALVSALSGCAPSPDTIGDGGSVAPTSTPPASSDTSAPVDGLEVRLVKVADGFDSPLYVTGAGDGSGRLFVVEQGGRIWTLRDGVKSSRPFLDVRDRITSGGERGLLGLAFHRDFETNGTYAVNFTDESGDTVVEARTAPDPAADSDTSAKGTAVFRQDQPYANHNGGCLQVGPDGALYVGMGDGGSGGDPENRAQNPDVLLGKLVRIDRIGWSDSGRTAGAPSPRAVALGLRNPWRFSFDRKTGDLYIGDVGQNEIEEIDAVSASEATAGLNFGWNWYEGTKRYRDGNAPDASTFVPPIAEYDHGQGNSVTGGYVYRGKKWPAAGGVYFYADFGSGKLWGLRWVDDRLVEKPVMLLETGLSVASFGQDDDGELYVCDLSGGALYRLEAGTRQ